ncbi:MAG TPA: hypothetical protein VNN73_03780 [Blastocatellia bacterium]|nr:hypothetical protein [Blastocatellia bacterium]
MVPFSVENKVNGQTIFTLTIDKYEPNVSIDDAAFKMPVKIQEKKPSGQ